MEKLTALIFGLALCFSLLLVQNFVKNIVALSRASNLSDVIDGHMMNRYLLVTTIILWTAFFYLN